MIDLGHDHEGDAITSCVVEPTEGEARKSRTRPALSDAMQNALSALRKAINEAGEVLPGGNHYPAHKREVSYELWRQYCYTASGEATDDAKRKAFNRSAQALQAKGIVKVWAGLVWLVENGT